MTTITLFQNIYPPAIENPVFLLLADALHDIKSGRYSELVLKIRSEPNKRSREKLKKKLPIYCFSGVFHRHEDAAIKTHSGFLALDLDKFDDPDQMLAFKNHLLASPIGKNILAIFISPSGQGLKVLVKIPPCTDEHHRGYFRGLKVQIADIHWDDSCINISRGHFASFDPGMYVNFEAEDWTELLLEIKQTSVSRVAPNSQSEADIMLRIGKWFEKKYRMVEGQRNRSLYILASTLNDFGVSKSYAEYNIINKYGQILEEGEIKLIVRSAYKKQGGTKQFIDKNDKNVIVNTGCASIGNKGFVKYNDVSDIDRLRNYINQKYPSWINITVFDKQTRRQIQQILK